MQREHQWWSPHGADWRGTSEQQMDSMLLTKWTRRAQQQRRAQHIYRALQPYPPYYFVSSHHGVVNGSGDASNDEQLLNSNNSGSYDNIDIHRGISYT